MRHRTPVALLLLSALRAFAGCSTPDSPASGGAASASSGSSGAAGAAGACDGAAVVAHASPAAPSCDTSGQPMVAYGFAPSALPTGACAGPATCQLVISEPCCDKKAVDGGVAYRTDGWSCACLAGAWCCVVSSPSATACACP